MYNEINRGEPCLDLNPYKIKGRWYRFLIESDNSSYILTESDMEGAKVQSIGLSFASGFNPINIQYNMHFIGQSTTVYGLTPKVSSTGWKYYPLPAVTSFDYGEVYVFGYFEDSAG